MSDGRALTTEPLPYSPASGKIVPSPFLKFRADTEPLVVDDHINKRIIATRKLQKPELAIPAAATSAIKHMQKVIGNQKILRLFGFLFLKATSTAKLLKDTDKSRASLRIGNIIPQTSTKQGK